MNEWAAVIGAIGAALGVIATKLSEVWRAKSTADVEERKVQLTAEQQERELLATERRELINELRTQAQELRSEIAALREENAKLRERISELERLVASIAEGQANLTIS